MSRPDPFAVGDGQDVEDIVQLGWAVLFQVGLAHRLVHGYPAVPGDDEHRPVVSDLGRILLDDLLQPLQVVGVQARLLGIDDIRGKGTLLAHDNSPWSLVLRSVNTVMHRECRCAPPARRATEAYWLSTSQGA